MAVTLGLLVGCGPDGSPLPQSPAAATSSEISDAPQAAIPPTQPVIPTSTVPPGSTPEPTATATPTPTATPEPTATPAPTETPSVDIGTLSADGTSLWTGNEWRIATYQERIAGSPDAYVCLPEFCGNGALTVDQSAARKEVYDYFYSLMEWEPNRDVYVNGGINVFVQEPGGTMRLVTREEFETLVINNDEIIPPGLAYPGGTYFIDDVGHPADTDYFTMAQTTKVPLHVDGGVFELLTVEQTGAARNTNVDYGFGKHILIKIFNVGGGAPNMHVGMAEPVTIGDKNIPRFVLAAGNYGTHIDLHPSPEEGPEAWENRVRSYNLLLRFIRTLPGFAQSVTDKWGPESQFVAQTELTLGVHLTHGFTDENNVFIASLNVSDK
ncbi:MAG: hypothetical protein KJ046_17175 [Anaerolineae bacterium]|nr:hypothetical protein [Anaerolineae bacterium]